MFPRNKIEEEWMVFDTIFITRKKHKKFIEFVHIHNLNVSLEVVPGLIRIRILEGNDYDEMNLIYGLVRIFAFKGKIRYHQKDKVIEFVISSAE